VTTKELLRGPCCTWTGEIGDDARLTAVVWGCGDPCRCTEARIEVEGVTGLPIWRGVASEIGDKPSSSVEELRAMIEHLRVQHPELHARVEVEEWTAEMLGWEELGGSG
jgi:hypothetical protein